MNTAYLYRDELLEAMEEHARAFLNFAVSHYPDEELKASLGGMNAKTAAPVVLRTVNAALLRARVTTINERRLGVEDAYQGTVSVVLDLYAQTRTGERIAEQVVTLAEEYFRGAQAKPCGGWNLTGVRVIGQEPGPTGKHWAWAVDGWARWRLPDPASLVNEDTFFPLLHDDTSIPLETEVA